MLSGAESSRDITPAAARAALEDARRARSSFAGDLVLPRGYSLLTGAGNAALVGGVAAGNSDWSFGSAAFVLGLLAQLAATAEARRRFKQRNGAWIDGLGGRRASVMVAALFVALILVLCVAAAWLTVGDRPVLAALVALAAVPSTALVDRWWMARHRAGA